jgi:hypothetical protein
VPYLCRTLRSRSSLIRICVHYACGKSLFGRADKTAPGEATAGNALRYGGQRDALIVRGYLAEEERDKGAAIKKAIEGVISDMAFELQSETAERTRAGV